MGNKYVDFEEVAVLYLEKKFGSCVLWGAETDVSVDISVDSI